MEKERKKVVKNISKKIVEILKENEINTKELMLIEGVLHYILEKEKNKCIFNYDKDTLDNIIGLHIF